MHIVGLIAENVKRLRVVEIAPKGGLIQITGKNGQGKTSVLDSIWIGLAGKRAMPDKPVRKGAEKARIKLNLGELLITRTIGANGTMSLNVESSAGAKYTSPQQVLDELLGALTFDPLAFIAMKPKEQIDSLRAVVKIDVDIKKMNEENETDFAARRDLNRDIERLKAEMNTIMVQQDLPKTKQDEKPLLEAIESAGKANEEARRIDEARNQIQQNVQTAAGAVYICESQMQTMTARVNELATQLEEAKASLGKQNGILAKVKEEFTSLVSQLNESPTGQYVDVGEVSRQLQQVQLVNREIEKRTRRDNLRKELETIESRSAKLTRAMAQREETKREAIQNAPMPIPGLRFDDNEITFNAIPLDQLGEAEQIKISTSIAMAANPKLRILLIQHGEALDDDSIGVLAQMADEHDFQIWMARVDTSGKVGIVMEDGSVKPAQDEEVE
jgi:hypothetical protein